MISPSDSSFRLALLLSATVALVVILNPPRRLAGFWRDTGGDESLSCSFQDWSGAASASVPDLPGGLAGIPGLVQQVRRGAVHPGRAVAQLTRLGPDAALALVPTLDDTNPAVREVATRAFAALNVRLAPHAAEILPPLIRRLRDPQYSIRYPATIALIGLPVSGAEAIAGLITEIEGSVPLPQSDATCLKSAAAHVLGKIGPEAAAAVPALRIMLEDGNVETHGVVAMALWRITYDTNALLPALCASLSGTNEEARFQAALILEKLQAETPLPPCLVQAMQAASR